MESWAFALDAKGLQAVVGGGAFARRTCKLCDDGIVVEGEYRISKAWRWCCCLAKSKPPPGPVGEWVQHCHAAGHVWKQHGLAGPDNMVVQQQRARIPAWWDGTAACVRIPAYTQVPTMASTCIHSRRCLSRRAGLWYVCQLFSETTSSGVTTQGEPFVARYSRWFMKRALGRSTAEGTKDLKKYRWVVFVCVLSCIALAPQWPRRYFISNAAIQRQDMSACYPFLRG